MQNKFKAPFLMTLALLLSTAAWAQKGTPAYLVTLANDTIRGTVNKQKLKSITNTLYFKATSQSTYNTYSTTQVKFFVVEDNLFFEPVTATLNEQPQQVFMRVLVKGPVKLYHNDNLSATSHYFVQKLNDPLVQLRKNSLSGTLNYLLQDCAETSKHRAYRYTTAALASEIDAYNKCKYPSEPSNVLLVHTKLQYHAGVRAGAHGGSFSYTGRTFEQNIPQTQNSANLDFTGAAFVNVSAPTTNFGLQAELIFKRFNGSQEATGISGHLFDYNFSSQAAFTFLQMPVLLRYDVKTNSSWTPYLVAGPSFSYILKSSFDNSITYSDKYITYTLETSEQLDELTSGYAAGIGIEYPLFKKACLVLDARYERSKFNGAAQIEDTNTGRTFNVSSLLFTLGIAF